MKKIDVLLPIYNESLDYVSKSIQSILNQTYNYFKLIIIFDSPTNYEVINYVENLKMSDLRIITIKNKTNIGLVASLNKAIQYCTDDYVARMDADDISELDRFEKQINFLEKNHLDFIGSNAIGFSENKVLYKTELPVDDDTIKKNLRLGNCFFHPTFFFKTEILKNIQYENALYCEDYLFVLRVANSNYKMGNNPEYLLKYRVNLNSISNSHAAEQYIYAKYIKKLYKKNKNIDMLEFENYCNSIKCKKKIKKAVVFFDLKKQYKNENKILKKYFFLQKMFFISPSDFLFFSYSKFKNNYKKS